MPDLDRDQHSLLRNLEVRSWNDGVKPTRFRRFILVQFAQQELQRDVGAVVRGHDRVDAHQPWTFASFKNVEVESIVVRVYQGSHGERVSLWHSLSRTTGCRCDVRHKHA